MTKLKLALALALVFILGNVSGVVLAKKERMRSQKNQTLWVERFKEDAKRLGLTPDQEPAVREQYKAFATSLLALREETSGKVRESIRSHASQINALLQPHQQEIFQTLTQDRLNRWRQRRD